MGSARAITGAVLLAAALVPGVPGAAVAGQALTLALTGADGRPAAGVAVYLPGVTAPAAPGAVVVDQRREAFVPVVSVVQAGSEVQFTNSDPTSHHV